MTVRMLVICCVLLVLGVSGCAKDYRVQSVLNTSRAQAMPYLVSADSKWLGDVQVINPYTYNPAMLDVKDRVSGSSRDEAEKERRKKELAQAKDDLKKAREMRQRLIEESNRPSVAVAYTETVDKTNLTRENLQRADADVTNGEERVAKLEADVARPVHRPLYDVASDSTLDESTRKQARNALIEAIIAASDDNADVHLAGLKATESNINLILGAAALGLTGGASVTSGAMAKGLAAASTGVQGARALVNEEVYAQALAESIVTLVKATRKDQADKLRARFGEDLVTFPMEQGISLALEYHNTASAYNGLALARQAIEHEALRKRGDEGPNGLGSPEEQLAAAKKNLASMQIELAAKEEAKKAIDTLAASRKEELKKPSLTADQRSKIQAEIDGLELQAKELEKQIASKNDAIAAKKAVITKLIELATQRLNDEKAALDKPGTDQPKPGGSK